MKWIAALLMIANVAVYLWASGRQVSLDEITSASKPDVNKEGMLLLQETSKPNQVEDPGQTQSLVSEIIVSELDESEPVAVVTLPDPAQPENAETENSEVVDPEESGDQESELVQVEDSIDEQDEVTEQTETVQIPSHICYRVGPFKKEESWLSALQWMAENDVEFRHVTSESRELRAVRVFLGPYDSISAATPMVAKLKEKDLDHFVYLIDNGLARISLGYFTQEELAAKFLVYLQSIDVQAESQPEYRLLGPFNWMEIPLENISQEKLTSRDWEEPVIRLSTVDC